MQWDVTQLSRYWFYLCIYVHLCAFIYALLHIRSNLDESTVWKSVAELAEALHRPNLKWIYPSSVSNEMLFQSLKTHCSPIITIVEAPIQIQSFIFPFYCLLENAFSFMLCSYAFNYLLSHSLFGTLLNSVTSLIWTRGVIDMVGNFLQ